MTLHRFVRLAFRTTAIVEACTWVGMLTSLFVKYGLQGSPLGVTVFGWIHGWAWILFVIACIVAAIVFRWSWWVALVGLAMSVVPFLTVPFDIWMEKSRRLLPSASVAR